MGFIASIPDGWFFGTNISVAPIESATALGVVGGIQAGLIKNACAGSYNVFLFSFEDPGVTLKWQCYAAPVSTTAAQLSMVGSDGFISSLGAADFSGLDDTDLIFFAFGINPGAGSNQNRFAIHLPDGTPLLAESRSISTTPLSTDTGNGYVTINSSRYFLGGGSLSKASAWDGFAVFDHIPGGSEQWTVPDPNGAGVIRSWSFSNGSGPAVTCDTDDGEVMGTFSSPGVLDDPTWVPGGIWEGSVVSVEIPPGVVSALYNEGMMSEERIVQRGTNPQPFKGFPLLSATTGKSLTGQTASTVTVRRARNGALSTGADVTLADIAFNAVRTDGGFAEDGTTGYYRFDPPATDAAVGTDGAGEVTYVIEGADILPQKLKMVLSDYPPDQIDKRDFYLHQDGLDAAFGIEASRSPANKVESGVSLMKALRRILSVLIGTTSKPDGTHRRYNAGGSSQARVTTEIDGTGNRLSAVFDDTPT